VVIETLKSKFVDCIFSNQLTIHKVVIKVGHSFVIKDWYSSNDIFKLLCFTR